MQMSGGGRSVNCSMPSYQVSFLKVPFKFHSSNVNSMKRHYEWHGKAFRRALRGGRDVERQWVLLRTVKPV